MKYVNGRGYGSEMRPVSVLAQIMAAVMVMTRVVLGTVYVGFPFDEQLPDVGRVDEAYSFTMANVTYKSTSGTVSYSVSNLPSWLKFDGGSRTFSGTPSKSDVGSFEITLAGSDSDNSVSNNYSMIVSSDAGLHLRSSDVMYTEIAQYGKTNGEDGLVVRPGQDINIQFDSSVFESYSSSNRNIKAYYGRSEDRSSLPNWIEFDSDKLAFVGTVPDVTSDIAPSFSYGFSFIASDYYGYAGAVGSFKLVVGAHELSMSLNETIKINGTLDTDFEEEVPVLSDVYLDDELISKSNISKVYADDLPDYADLDKDDYKITGKFPDSSTSDNFTVVVEDKYGNTVKIPYQLSAIGSVFTTKNLPDVNATKGDFFEHELLKSLFTDYDDTTISVSYNADWLSYDKSNRTFTGEVPDDFKKLAVAIKASSDYGSETKKFEIKGVDGHSTKSSSSSSSSSSHSSTTSSSSKTGEAGKSNSNKDSSGSHVNRKALAIGLGVGIPVFILLVAALFLLCCCLRRRKNSKDQSDDAEMGNKGQPPSGDDEKLTSDQSHTDGDFSEEAKPLATLDALRFKKEDKSEGFKSPSSSITHVETRSDEYYDATEKPVRSWRAEGKSDSIVDPIIQKNLRMSQASLSTVNTEQLFSVRLVDDNSARNSNRSSFGSQQFLSQQSLNNAMSRDSSGNIQKLDSDGNMVDTYMGGNKDKGVLSTAPSSNLNSVAEEGSQDLSNTFGDNSTIYHSTSFNTTIRDNDTDGDSNNLLQKIEDPQNTSTSSSEQDLSRYGDVSSHSLEDDFKATKSADGQFKWMDDRSSSNLDSPVSEHFFNSAPTNLKDIQNEMQQANSSSMSVDTVTADTVSKDRTVTSTASLPKKAKLVDFTRKGSLKDAAQKPDHFFEEQTAQIQDYI